MDLERSLGRPAERDTDPDSHGPRLPSASARRTTLATTAGTGRDDVERLSGTHTFRDVLDLLHLERAPDLYVEVGVRHGRSLQAARCRAIGVDPQPEIEVDLPSTATVVPQTSDDWFAAGAPGVEAPIDLAFIDGMHLAEFALRDFINLERLMHPAGVIVIDDISPNHPVQGARERTSRAWTGDVWQVVEVLRRRRRDLTVITLDTHPTGLAIVVGLSPHNTRLADDLPELEAAFREEAPVPDHVLTRQGAWTDLSALRMLMLELRTRRHEDATISRVRTRIAQVLATTSVGTGAIHG